jgi:hypothetical protein
MNESVESSTDQSRVEVSRTRGRLTGRAGLSLVELVIAMLILTVGLLGMAAGTGWMVRSMDLARLETARSAALQEGIEFVRDTPFENLGAGQLAAEDFDVTWSLVEQDMNSVLLEFVVEGPGRAPGSVGPGSVISMTVADTLRYRINRP